MLKLHLANIYDYSHKHNCCRCGNSFYVHAKEILCIEENHNVCSEDTEVRFSISKITLNAPGLPEYDVFENPEKIAELIDEAENLDKK